MSFVVCKVSISLQISKMSQQKTYRYKGKRVSEKQYNHMVQRSLLGKSNLGRKAVAIEPEEVKNPALDGVRILDLKYMAKFMVCKSCDDPLLIQCIESERREGLASYFGIRCSKCSYLNTVTSGEQYQLSEDDKKKFAINTKAVLGNFISVPSKFHSFSTILIFEIILFFVQLLCILETDILILTKSVE